MINLGSNNKNTVNGGQKPPFGHRQFWLILVMILVSMGVSGYCLI